MVDTVVPAMLQGQKYTPAGGLSAAVGPTPTFVIITDGRFANEVLAVKRVGGYVWHVQRDDKEYRESAAYRALLVHDSEKLEIPAWWNDARLFNDKNKGELGLSLLVSSALHSMGRFAFRGHIVHEGAVFNEAGQRHR